MTDRGEAAVHGPSWRYNDSRNKLSDAENRALAALERGLVAADPRLARRVRKFGVRGRFARVVAGSVFVVVSLAMVVGLAMITPVLAVTFGPPICVFVGMTVCWVLDGPGSRRRRSGPVA